MRGSLAAYDMYQVFLNHPFDEEFEPFAQALHFSVVAAGLIPVCANDLNAPDRPRLEMLVDAITHCHYSIHDFSRSRGEGSNNFARFNMPIEMGMALFHALNTQRNRHRCAFFVATPYDYQVFASDLSGLDPKHYDKDDDLSLAASVYDWLRGLGNPLIKQLPTAEVKKKYRFFKEQLKKIEGGGKDDYPSHDEVQELMFRICSDCKWWTLRDGTHDLPTLPLSWKDASSHSLHSPIDVVPKLGST
ncbi:hypothetical protein KSF_088240 [Reticulibacter mediterranei]|uniref:Uncharacterized protein n=1 Tax=Reticulibacter mediterranei TaxID=2778369 RepID=A0A8J3IZC3_9CHLR|nr:hypothetical protein [Reticulibacter mediterranei]GHO98776.1 hypothetical protein KSF_088240 [Reticulibacter mediterranei]